MSKYTDNKKIINRIINDLLANKYLDINRYIKAYINDKIKYDKWGRYKIAYSLKQKKLPEKIVNDVLSQIDMEEYRNILKDLIKSKSAVIRETDLSKRKVALTRFCVGRGYEYEMICHILDGLE